MTPPLLTVSLCEIPSLVSGIFEPIIPKLQSSLKHSWVFWLGRSLLESRDELKRRQAWESFVHAETVPTLEVAQWLMLCSHMW